MFELAIVSIVFAVLLAAALIGEGITAITQYNNSRRRHEIRRL